MIRIILRALIVLAVLGGIASASSASTTTVVHANIGPFISLDVPGPLTGWTIHPGEDNAKTISNGLAVSSNAPWNVFVQTALNVPRRSNDYYGHLWSPTAYKAGLGAYINGKGPGFLENALVLNAGSDVTLSDEPALLAHGASPGITTIPFDMKQTVTFTDPAMNDYRIVLEFTASN